MRTVKTAAAAMLFTLVAAACGGSSSQESIVIMTPASLAESFTDLAAAFETAHPDYEVRINLAGTSALREQVLEGAPGDVFVSANVDIMQQLVEANAVTASQPLMSTELRIATPKDNPASITELADFANEDALIGLCSEGVPCGDYARDALEAAGVTPAIDTNETNVRALLAKIAAGELDAGIVYVSEIRASDEVLGFEQPALSDVEVLYPIGVLAEAPNPAGAQLFADFALSPDGQQLLAEHGYRPA